MFYAVTTLCLFSGWVFGTKKSIWLRIRKGLCFGLKYLFLCLQPRLEWKYLVASHLQMLKPGVERWSLSLSSPPAPDRTVGLRTYYVNLAARCYQKGNVIYWEVLGVYFHRSDYHRLNRAVTKISFFLCSLRGSLVAPELQPPYSKTLTQKTSREAFGWSFWI